MGVEIGTDDRLHAVNCLILDHLSAHNMSKSASTFAEEAGLSFGDCPSRLTILDMLGVSAQSDIGIDLISPNDHNRHSQSMLQAVAGLIARFHMLERFKASQARFVVSDQARPVAPSPSTRPHSTGSPTKPRPALPITPGVATPRNGVVTVVAPPSVQCTPRDLSSIASRISCAQSQLQRLHDTVLTPRALEAGGDDDTINDNLSDIDDDDDIHHLMDRTTAMASRMSELEVALGVRGHTGSTPIAPPDDLVEFLRGLLQRVLAASSALQEVELQRTTARAETMLGDLDAVDENGVGYCVPYDEDESKEQEMFARLMTAVRQAMAELSRYGSLSVVKQAAGTRDSVSVDKQSSQGPKVSRTLFSEQPPLMAADTQPLSSPQADPEEVSRPSPAPAVVSEPSVPEPSPAVVAGPAQPPAQVPSSPVVSRPGSLAHRPAAAAQTPNQDIVATLKEMAERLDLVEAKRNAARKNQDRQKVKESVSVSTTSVDASKASTTTTNTTVDKPDSEKIKDLLGNLQSAHAKLAEARANKAASGASQDISGIVQSLKAASQTLVDMKKPATPLQHAKPAPELEQKPSTQAQPVTPVQKKFEISSSSTPAQLMDVLRQAESKLEKLERKKHNGNADTVTDKTTVTNSVSSSMASATSSLGSSAKIGSNPTMKELLSTLKSAADKLDQIEAKKKAQSFLAKSANGVTAKPSTETSTNATQGDNAKQLLADLDAAVNRLNMLEAKKAEKPAQK